MKIKFNPIPPKSSTLSATYTDLDLHLENRSITNNELNKKNETNDLQILQDLVSIKNSLKTLFTTRKGQKHLNPNYGCNLENYLFEPLTDQILNFIGDDIRTQIVKYEPRITITNIDITGKKDENAVYIILSFNYNKIPASISFTANQYSITFN